MLFNLHLLKLADGELKQMLILFQLKPHELLWFPLPALLALVAFVSSPDYGWEISSFLLKYILIF